MNFTKSLLTFGLVSSLCVGCKDAGSKAVADSTETATTTQKTIAAKPKTASFTIDGMVCPDGCAKTIEKKLSKMDGVQNAKVDFGKKEATVNFDGAVLTPEQLVKAVESTGDGATYKVSNVKTNEKA